MSLLLAIARTINLAKEVLGGGHRKATEKELWEHLQEPYVFRPKETQQETPIIVVPPVILPAREGVTPSEISSAIREVVSKFTSGPINSPDDDEEAILFL